MKTAKKRLFTAGRNIAMKVPPHAWEATVAFYRDVVGLESVPHDTTVPPSVGFEFGSCRLWIDRVETASHAEVWLQLDTPDPAAAAKAAKAAGLVRCDEIEKLPDGFDGFWIQNPASIVHLVAKTGEA